ncbi:hypothetical protein H5410_045198 [Solanum commersonii]|uniref:60S ribosomal protein L41 n=1 Tax=Solanum commersonii TaxID=4109 RepID=A0A9J5XC26_SOLCO|nr:hypothetical protein H5410_045198 [Solanum commersonii]
MKMLVNEIITWSRCQLYRVNLSVTITMKRMEMKFVQNLRDYTCIDFSSNSFQGLSQIFYRISPNLWKKKRMRRLKRKRRKMRQRSK